MTKMLSASGGLCPPDQGLCPWTPLAALPPDTHYRLVLCTRHGVPQPLTPSATYDPRASRPPTYFDKFTPMGIGVVICLERGAIVCILSTWCHCIPKPHHLLPHLNPDWFYLSGTVPFNSDIMRFYCISHYRVHLYSTKTHTHTHPFNGPFSETTQVSRYQKGKTIWILLKQETVSCSGISWTICKSASRTRQITMPAPHCSVFLQAGCPSCRPTVSKHWRQTHPSWSSDILYHLPPFTTIHGILFVRFTSLTVLSDNLSPGPLWFSSWPWTLNFILYAFLHPIIIIFSQHMPIPTQPVLLQYQCYVIYT